VWRTKAEIRRLRRAEQMPIKQIARYMGISRNTVKRALASNDPPRYRRAPQGSIVDAVEPQIRVLLAEFPHMPATVIAERVGWQRGMTVLKAARCGAAPGVCAGGSGLKDGLSARGAGAV